jgi:DNA-binding IclR family transcriptional regulator
MTDKPQAKDRKFATTLARGLSILRAFRASDDGLSHAEIAVRTGLPKPTLTRLTYTLTELGYLSHTGRNDKFRLGPAVLSLGSVAQVSISFVEMASEAMQKLADDSGTLSLIAIRDGDRMMLARTWRPRNEASIWLEPGHRLDVFGSSSGLAALSLMSDDVFEQLSPDADQRRLRANGYSQLVARGFVVTPADTHYTRKINAVSVPFYAGEYGAPVAFTCGALPDVLSVERMEKEVGPALRDLVRNLELRTGRAPSLSRRG